ncbi:hypothetical protein [Shewanella subflava]|uniref:HTH cro/C1-type domain-containing protein n=1 Tax=Shewanella subflava TaxID=2986476 RepID=A0ABT3IA18_9GAMM|nr:hypothetical protein [Shewanella subflava]MCW3172901.1 hypothetical protein [Shewanella subflava]
MIYKLSIGYYFEGFMPINIATIKALKSCKKVKIHPNAYKVFEFVNSLDFSFCGAIKQDLVNKKLLTVGLVLHAKKVGDELLIYSGFESILFDINTINLTECTVILDDDISDSEIELQAWIGVFTNCFLRSISSKNLNVLHTKVNELVDSKIAKQIFNRTHLSQNYLAQMAGKSKDAIAKQKSRQNKPPQDKSITIFEQLKESINEQ